MGGCRCTYRNCNVKSDGKTHMFHFPVFDKVRCHQWLVNAERLDFLDLKVSQLKNRCICQHHFKDENFMNYKKDKLTFDAVPTIDGPFCDPIKLEGLVRNQKYPNPILVEDIENDYDINDKQSNFALKYGDFLTNSEFVDSSSIYNRHKIIQTKDNTLDVNTNSYFFSPNVKEGKNPLVNPNNSRLLKTKKIKQVTPLTQPMVLVSPYSDLSNELKMGKELNLEHNLSDLETNLKLQDKNYRTENICVGSSTQSGDIAFKSNQDFSNELKIGKELNLDNFVTDPISNLPLQDNNSKPENISSKQSVDNASKSNQAIINTVPKVTILSEKQVKEPINIAELAGKLEKISPSRPLKLPNRSHILSNNEKGRKGTRKSSIVESENKPSEKLKALEILDVEFDPVVEKPGLVQILDVEFNPVVEKPGLVQNKATTNKIENIAHTRYSPPKKLIQLKNKVTPERSAAIEKKRKFNMKLKDIIESCLDKLDDPLKNYEITPNPINNIERSTISSVEKNIKFSEKCKSIIPAEKVVSSLAEDKSLPNVQDYTIAYLEDRMKKMENTLLNKIAQNSKEIIDFKNTLVKDSSQFEKKEKFASYKRAASTQTNENESCYKKFLYQEISKYLSPSANSVIYEELFINDYSCVKERPSNKKSRR